MGHHIPFFSLFSDLMFVSSFGSLCLSWALLHSFVYTFMQKEHSEKSLYAKELMTVTKADKNKQNSLETVLSLGNAPWVKCLRYKCEDLSFTPSTHVKN